MKIRDLLRITASYRQASLSGRAYVLGRMILCPFQRVVDDVPQNGSLLDFGCGSGVWLNYLSRVRPRLRLSGVDIDPRKIDLARSCGLAGAHFDTLDPQAPLPEAAYDVITCLDVLYLLPEDQTRAILERFFHALKPGGLLLVKEMCDTPRYKHAVANLHEIITVRMLGFTAGSHICIKPLDTHLDMTRSCGYEQIRARRIDSGYPHPAVLIRAHKPLTKSDQ